MKVSRRAELFPHVTDAEWNDWRWQIKNRVETLEDLKKYVSLTPEEAWARCAWPSPPTISL